jgi:hypothetical protein
LRQVVSEAEAEAEAAMRAEAAQAAKQAKAAKAGLVTVAEKDPQWEQLKREVAAMQLDSSLVQVDVEALRARVESDWQVRARALPIIVHARDGTRKAAGLEVL